MTRPSLEERMLDSMIDATRNGPPPEIDLDALELKLRRRWVGQSMKAPRNPVNWRWVTGFSVAASVLVGGMVTQRYRVHADDDLARLSSEVKSTDASGLKLGQLLVAEDQPISVVHDNVARWTLAPHGEAKIVVQGRYLTVSLESGRIEAQVLPSKQPESFAIETNGRRIAVHGTRFSVERQSDGTLVEVMSGSVVVGSPGQRGQTAGTLVTAPQRLRFPLVEPNASTQYGHAPGVAESAAAHRSRTFTNARVGSSTETTRAEANVPVHPLPERSSPIEQETALDVVRAAAAQCFARAKTDDNGRDSRVVVRVETQLTVTIAPNGTVQDVAFSPPVPDEIMDCARREVGNWSTSPSQMGSTASRAIMLMK